MRYYDLKVNLLVELQRDVMLIKLLKKTNYNLKYVFFYYRAHKSKFFNAALDQDSEGR